jgi:hypothetical protein
MSTNATTPDTIVLIHGFWVTPRSWEDWKARYESRGYRVLAPAYPGFEVEVEALNADPTPIEELTVPAILEQLESVVGELDTPPILMGHSAGGVFTQILMDRGYGAAGVAINSAPTEGVKRVPLSQIRSSFPVLKNPANRHKAVGFTFEQWRYVFTNTFSEEEARRLYERYHIPASGRVFWGSALANIHPGPDDTHVDYKNPNRAPLLFISGSGGSPHAPVDPALEREALQGGRHDHRAEGVRGSRTPHARAGRVGGGRRLRPDLGRRAGRVLGRSPPPGVEHRMTALGLGQAGRACDRRFRPGPIDAVLVTHDRHHDNLDPAGRALLRPPGSSSPRFPERSGWAVVRADSRHGDTTPLFSWGRGSDQEMMSRARNTPRETMAAMTP